MRIRFKQVKMSGKDHIVNPFLKTEKETLCGLPLPHKIDNRKEVKPNPENTCKNCLRVRNNRISNLWEIIEVLRNA